MQKAANKQIVAKNHWVLRVGHVNDKIRSISLESLSIAHRALRSRSSLTLVTYESELETPTFFICLGTEIETPTFCKTD